jgi:hypothetical protein
MWAQALNVMLGIWLMVAPDALGFSDPARVVDRIVGPVAIFFAALALRDVTRPVRWANLITGAALLVAPWIVGYHTGIPLVNSLVVGILLILFAALGGRTHQQTGGGWSSLLRSQS